MRRVRSSGSAGGAAAGGALDAGRRRVERPHQHEGPKCLVHQHIDRRGRPAQPVGHELADATGEEHRGQVRALRAQQAFGREHGRVGLEDADVAIHAADQVLVRKRHDLEADDLGSPTVIEHVVQERLDADLAHRIGVVGCDLGHGVDHQAGTLLDQRGVHRHQNILTARKQFVEVPGGHARMRAQPLDRHVGVALGGEEIERRVEEALAAFGSPHIGRTAAVHPAVWRIRLRNDAEVGARAHPERLPTSGPDSMTGVHRVPCLRPGAHCHPPTIRPEALSDRSNLSRFRVRHQGSGDWGQVMATGARARMGSNGRRAWVEGPPLAPDGAAALPAGRRRGRADAGRDGRHRHAVGRAQPRPRPRRS